MAEIDIKIIESLDINANILQKIAPSRHNEAINLIAQMYQNGEIQSGTDALNVLTEKNYFEQMTSTMADNEMYSGISGIAGGALSQVIGNSDTIKFDPAKLLEASEKLNSQHKRYVQCIASIKRKAENLLGSWQGDSSALYIDKIKELDLQNTEAAKTLQELAGDLAAASGIYKAGESDAKKKAEALPTDGVFFV